MKKFTIAGIGELLWDVLPATEELGGAPVNFAYHVNALGATGIPISTIGTDDRGEKALNELTRKGVKTSAISSNSQYPTGFVDALVDNEGVATYRFPDNVAWDYLNINSVANELQNDLDAVCFGSLAQRSVQSHQVIQRFLNGLKAGTLKIFDVNLRQNFYSLEVVDESLSQADIVKLNDEELSLLAELLHISSGEKAALETLLKMYSLEMVILTRGSKGSLIMTPEEISELPGTKIEVVDTIGAGDSFTAAVTIGYLQQRALAEIHRKASELAAFVCSRRGAMVMVPDTLAMIRD
jgi:fructokinase